MANGKHIYTIKCLSKCLLLSCRIVELCLAYSVAIAAAILCIKPTGNKYSAKQTRTI